MLGLIHIVRSALVPSLLWMVSAGLCSRAPTSLQGPPHRPAAGHLPLAVVLLQQRRVLPQSGVFGIIARPPAFFFFFLVLYTLGLSLLPLRRPSLSSTIGGDLVVSFTIRLEHGTEVTPPSSVHCFQRACFVPFFGNSIRFSNLYPIRSTDRKNGSMRKRTYASSPVCAVLG